MAEPEWEGVGRRQEATVGRPGRAYLVSHTVLPRGALQDLLQSCGGPQEYSDPGPARRWAFLGLGLPSTEMGGYLRDRLGHSCGTEYGSQIYRELIGMGG